MVSGTFVLFSSKRIVLPEAAESSAMGVMGMYKKVAGLSQGGWPVYERVGSTVQYMFFWPVFQRWLIGPDYRTGASTLQSGGGFAFGAEQVVSIRSSSAATAPRNALGVTCPDEASDWVIFDGQIGWISTYPITVREGASEPPSIHASYIRQGLGC
jgi:hypothetical protein